MNRKPSRLLWWLFSLLSPRERRPELRGDFLEIFRRTAETRGVLRANLEFLSELMQLMRFSGYLNWLHSATRLAMFKWAIKQRFRVLIKFRPTVLLALFTLAAGAVTSGFLIHYFQYERSYDGFHIDAENLYRVNSISRTHRGELSRRAIAPMPAGAVLSREIDEIETFARVQSLKPTVIFEDQAYDESGFFLTDNSFFDLFDFPIVKGNAISPLSEPQSVVITESMALKYFGTEDPIGQVIKIEVRKTFALPFTTESFVVRAVAKDPPANTHLSFRFLASMTTLGDFKSDDWLGGVATYVKLKPDHDVALINTKFEPLIRQNLGPYLQARFNMSYEAYLESGRQSDFYLQPVQDIHIDSGLNLEFEQGVSENFLFVTLSVALLIFCLTAVNYFNISVANGLTRLREIGVRKSMGAFRWQVFVQFLSESLVMGGFSLVIALLLIGAADLSLDSDYFDLTGMLEQSERFWLIVGATTLLLSLLPGLFVAVTLSRISVGQGLSGKPVAGHRGIAVQKIFLGLQFFVAFLTLISAIIFQFQNDFLINADLGFNQDKLVVIKNLDKVDVNAQQVYLNALEAEPAVLSAARSYHVPGEGFETVSFKTLGFDDPDEEKRFSVLGVDEQFVQAYDLDLLAGEAAVFRDSSRILINEEAMLALGILKPEDAIGKRLDHYGKTLHIKGVVSNFHFENLYRSIGPLVIMSPRGFPETPNTPYRYFSLRLSNTDAATLTGLEKAWDKLNLTTPLELDYLQDDLKQSYQSEQRLARLVEAATLVSIIIALLGLLAMAEVVFRRKLGEIAVRKVLGAGQLGIYRWFVKGFLWPLLIAFLVAMPLGVWYLDGWLNQFAYHVSWSWKFFFLSGFGLGLLSLTVLTINAMKAVRQNPVKYLHMD